MQDLECQEISMVNLQGNQKQSISNEDKNYRRGKGNQLAKLR